MLNSFVMNISSTTSWQKLIRLPIAFIPIVMSVLALAVLAIHIIKFGAAREADEGTTAHIWQLLMAGQVPLVAFFAVRWSRESPLATVEVLGIQFAAAALSCAPVIVLGL
jgi:hypothetical protein